MTLRQDLVENCIVWPNAIEGSFATVRTSLLPNAASFPGAGNISSDPMFVNQAAGNLRLQPGSPCIDRGNNFIDYQPLVPGFQLLPATDLDGNPRIVDGNGDATATVDMGPYEFQGP